MLDSDTKRRINTCRDILVGKVPDPKSQVEQITIALIYKFMDDMDLESEEMGGERTFFAGEFERYAWARLVAPGVGGQEMLNTYTEALTKMVENPGIPELFRSIFRNAYLPYRDPETLRSFLREINGFTYDHSERLGDAFEYLLSVLGSQGDAGQFRTPRHIIDFMVEIIDPKKDEVILDPACGTAGFLISSYKHILKANSTDAGSGNGGGAEVDATEATLDSPMRYSGDLLTPEDRLRLASNIKGYDISPDMVRLSLVNLYLHGFADPKVEEYDTLTSDDKWGETADVILANPPFMSPKGGIKPHNRFGVSSKRSEVLFVDYIAEHLNPKGRAAIVVPEGVIFQSQSAYCELRRMLVDKYLAAVISLPAGVFNPYSGVKTSILILDRSVAKASDSIAFLKIENDGFGLGAQRRAVKGSQLPQVKAELSAWLAAARGGGRVVLDSLLGFAVDKARIAEGGEYNLSGERYRENGTTHSEFPLVALGDLSLFKVEGGGTPKSDVPEYWDGGIKWATLVDLPQDDFISQISDTKRTISAAGLANSSAKVIPENSVIVSTRATIGRIGINRVPLATNQGFKNVVVQDRDRVSPEYVALALTRLVPTMKAWATGGTFAEISKSKFCELEIPLPPPQVQREIVAQIEGYQKVIDGARSVLENYRPYIPIDAAWPMSELGDVCSFASGGTPSKANDTYWTGQIPWVSAKDLKVDQIYDAGLHVSEAAVEESATQIAPVGSLLVLVRGMGLANGVPVCEVMVPCAFNQDLKALLPNAEIVEPRFLAFALRQQEVYFRKVLETAAHGTLKLNSVSLRQTKVPVPPLETQQAIVAEIEAEQALVNANRDLIIRFEKKVAQAIARVWGGAEEAVAA
ncbi:N-6 DNA methylase [Sphingobium fuliginis]|uniref:site-specific DNA-methyltransferase (adenine-specific) n=1 Tax=Sphingobium fuliginis ATCC 27551 TaxID=1208342 RepID=A0A5B8C9K9_SPHSA|nr:N-6 DNA methylase [Sphingobium fuliginis]QDC36028.1 restriction endonuclease subunit M/S [Sphingobium fuliginis ATCC 27551]